MHRLKPTCSTILVRYYSENIYKKYADTLSLPRTKFPNRPKQSDTQRFLKETGSDLYQWQSENLPETTLKMLHDGPPYANGELHLGHALNKTIKDIINRYNVIRGRKVHYVPGWDCHGLPIEHSALQKARKKHGSKVDRYSIYEKRELAAQLAHEMSAKQLEGFKNFAIMADWENGLIYKTLSTDYVLRQLRVFRSLVAQKLISRQDRPVFWSVESGTALAEGELQYGEKQAVAAQVKYPLTMTGEDMASILKENDVLLSAVNLLIWTTTPWTLVANKAIAVNSDIVYGLVRTDQEIVIVAKDLYENVSGKPLGIEFPGSFLIGSSYRDLIRSGDETYPVLSAHYVTSTSGTGLVHTAPGHGNEDYLLGKSHGIEAYSPIDERGRYNDQINVNLRDLIGLNARKEGQEQVLQKARDSGALVKTEKITHSVPLDWRTKTPVMVRSTPQMFANVESIKSKAVSSLDHVKFIPSGGKSRLTAFIESRNEWCISRQRAWGVPIPCVFEKETGEPIMSLEIVDKIIENIEKTAQISENPLSRWFKPQEDISEWLPDGFDGQKYRKGTDTMDVWFDSGTSWTMLQDRNGKTEVADYYLEGSDQHRGWFQSSLLTRIAAQKDEAQPRAPFKHLITHGFVLDKNGRKMSKSIGNVVSPQDLISGSNKVEAIGIDGMRLWIAQSDYTSDVTISPFIISQVAASMKKLRLTYKFLLGNLVQKEQDSPTGDVFYKELRAVDKKALLDLYRLNKTVTEAYDSFSFNRAVKAVQSHMNVALSAFYFDICKDRLYADGRESLSRKSAVYVLGEILKTYIILLAPITPLLSQEAWQASPGYITERADSPFKNGWIDPPEQWNNSEIGDDFETLLELRKSVTQTIELARTDKKLGSSLEADIYLRNVSSSELSPIIEKYKNELSDIFISSHVFIDDIPPSSDWFYQGDYRGIQIGVSPSKNHKCPRCWTFTSKTENTLCGRCSDVLGDTENVNQSR